MGSGPTRLISGAGWLYLPMRGISVIASLSTPVTRSEGEYHQFWIIERLCQQPGFFEGVIVFLITDCTVAQSTHTVAQAKMIDGRKSGTWAELTWRGSRERGRPPRGGKVPVGLRGIFTSSCPSPSCFLFPFSFSFFFTSILSFLRKVQSINYLHHNGCRRRPLQVEHRC